MFTDLTDEEINQIWAEAKVRYTQNEPLYLSKETEQLAKQVQSDHREVSVKEGLIRDFLINVYRVIGTVGTWQTSGFLVGDCNCTRRQTCRT